MNQVIRKKLDRITDILWAGGVTNPVTYIEQISYLIYLKLLDEEEASRELQGKLAVGNGKKLFPSQAERYRWSKWKFFSGDKLYKTLRDDVFPYMSSLVKDEPQIAQYFQDATLEIVDPNVLKQVIDELDAINFKKLGPDEKGDIFEYLLVHLGQSALNGQFRTPRQIRALMVELVDPDFGDSIYDPACGTGGFLVDALEYVLAKYSEEPVETPIYGEEWLVDKYRATLEGKSGGEDTAEDEVDVPRSFIDELKKEKKNLQTYRKGIGDKLPNWDLLEASLYGNDVSRQMMRIATMNMVLHGVPKSHIKRGNTLSEIGGLAEDDLRRKYTVILSNPPFAGVLPKDSIRKDLPTNSKKSELLFLGVMMEALAPGGRCAVIVPEGLLFGSTSAHVELRKKIVEEHELLAVVSLPPGVFKPYAGVKTGIIVFRKPRSETSTSVRTKSDQASSNRKIWFYEVENDGYDPERITGGGRPETPEKNDIPNLLGLWREFKSSGFTRPIGHEGGIVLEAGSEAPGYWWTTVASVSENNYDLSAGRYRPRVASEPFEANPVALIRELLDLHHSISASLERLMKEIK